MGKGRLEAFSDGVLAIILTIMVLELKAPHGTEWKDIEPLTDVFISYVLSFVYIGIYWNNHHHMLQASKHVNGKVLWANLHLLFWLSLVPFITAWMGENHFATVPVVCYGIVLLMASIAYYFLSISLKKLHGENSTISLAVGNDKKGLISTAIYILGIIFSFLHPYIGFGFYIIVAIIWFVPDTRIENKVNGE